jgi:hypothetical protein
MEQLCERGVYLVDLDEEVTMEMIYMRVNSIRPIEMINVPKFTQPGSKRGSTKGYAFVYFKSKAHAEDVIRALDHKVILSNTIRVLPIDNSFSTKTNLFVKGLAKTCTVKMLEAYVNQVLFKFAGNEQQRDKVVGGLYRAEIVFNRQPGREPESRGYGYIQFRSDEAMKEFKKLSKDNPDKQVGTLGEGTLSAYEFKSYNEREHLSNGLVIYNLSSVPKESPGEQRDQILTRLKEVFGDLFARLDLDKVKVCTTALGKNIVIVATKEDSKELYKHAAEHVRRYDEFEGRGVRVSRANVFDERGLILHNLQGDVSEQDVIREVQRNFNFMCENTKRKLQVLDCQIKKNFN